MSHRSIFSVLLAIVLVFSFSLGNVAEAKPKAKPTTYTPEQLETIQGYTAKLSAAQARLPELADLIQKQDWTYVRNFIHGPFGELRSDMANLSRNLLPEAQPEARKAARLVFDNLIAIDQAAEKQDYKAAIRNYGETIRDFEQFLQLTAPQRQK
jgi:photosystem II protein PsbQ